MYKVCKKGGLLWFPASWATSAVQMGFSPTRDQAPEPLTLTARISRTSDRKTLLKSLLTMAVTMDIYGYLWISMDIYGDADWMLIGCSGSQCFHHFSSSALRVCCWLWLF